MANHEEDIATFLTLDGHVFLAPQYNIAFDRTLNDGGATPDFVAIDLKLREVVVVEVTAASDPKSLICRVNERQLRWYNPIMRKMKELGVVDESWSAPRFLGFIRRNNLETFRRSFQTSADVAFWAIEDATFLWEYWDTRMKTGLPRSTTIPLSGG